MGSKYLATSNSVMKKGDNNKQMMDDNDKI
jgi:hypothetical protein